MTPRALRLAFDLDGVVADMDRELARLAEEMFSAAAGGPTASQDDGEESGEQEEQQDGEEEVRAPIPPRLSLTPWQQNRLWRRVRSVENFWETLDEVEAGVLRRMATMATEHRWETIFLTSRPRTLGATTQVQSQRWLESKGFDRPSVFVVTGSRGLIAAALNLDVVIDDRMENCMDVVADSKARAVLVQRDPAKPGAVGAQRFGIDVVASVAEYLDVLAHLGSAASNKPRTIDRVMRLLGLKEPGLD